MFAADVPLGRYAPGQIVETATLRRTVDLENFVGGVAQSRTVRKEAYRSPCRGWPKCKGDIEVADGNLPLVVRTPRRFGQVVFVAVDLDRRPFPDWEGRGNLVARLLGLSEPGTGPCAAANNPSTAMLARHVGRPTCWIKCAEASASSRA